jgi:hypothetical protein
MLNLFLAILLGNFDKARTFWLKKGIFEMFQTAIDKQYSLSKAISIILGDVNKSVKEELLVHSEQDIFRINGRLMIINRKFMENDPEAIDKLAYYDRLAVYETEYDPIIELYVEEHEEEADGDISEEDDGEESNSGHPRKLEKINENEDENINESGEELFLSRKDSKSLMIQ